MDFEVTDGRTYTGRMLVHACNGKYGFSRNFKLSIVNEKLQLDEKITQISKLDSWGIPVKLRPNWVAIIVFFKIITWKLITRYNPILMNLQLTWHMKTEVFVLELEILMSEFGSYTDRNNNINNNNIIEQNQEIWFKIQINWIIRKPVCQAKSIISMDKNAAKSHPIIKTKHHFVFLCPC